MQCTSERGLPYLLSMPSVGDAPHPLLLYLHGASARGKGFASFGTPQSSANVDAPSSMILVRPQCPEGNTWSQVSIRNQVIAMLDEICARVPVDPTRVCLAGSSMGGDGVWRLGAAHPERFAALVAVCSGDSMAHKVCAPKLSRVHCWVWHGKSDAVYPIEHAEEMVEALRRHGEPSRVRFSRLDEVPTPAHAPHAVGHAAWLIAFAKDSPLWPWALDRRALRATPLTPTEPATTLAERSVEAGAVPSTRVSTSPLEKPAAVASPPPSFPSPNFTREQLAARLDRLPTIGAGVPLPGEANARALAKRLNNPGAKVRLFALYGIGGAAVQLHEWCTSKPGWLEVRPLELPGHGWRAAEPVPFERGAPTDPRRFVPRADDAARAPRGVDATPTDVTPVSTVETPPADLTDPAPSASPPAHMPAVAVDSLPTLPAEPAALVQTFSAARDELVRALCDGIAPLLDEPYALYGFSVGAMVAYLMALELERRGMPPPRAVFCACRSAPHCVFTPAASIARVHGMDDESTIAWAEDVGILPKKEVRGPQPLRKGFAALARAGYVLAGIEVGHRTAEPSHSKLAYAKQPLPMLQAPLVALLGESDEMWPARKYLERWGDVAAGGIKLVTIDGPPHHELQSHPHMLKEVFAALADVMAAAA